MTTISIEEITEFLDQAEATEQKLDQFREAAKGILTRIKTLSGKRGTADHTDIDDVWYLLSLIHCILSEELAK